MKTSATPSESTFASATAATVRMKAASAETDLKAVDAPKVVVTVAAGLKAVSVADAPSPKMMRAK